jgi:hypothetical protein
MTREEVPGSSLVLCLGPGPSSLLHLTRANAEKPYAGDTVRDKHHHLHYYYLLYLRKIAAPLNLLNKRKMLCPTLQTLAMKMIRDGVNYILIFPNLFA